MERSIREAPLQTIEDCDISYLGKYFKSNKIKYPNFFVYGWRRDGEYLYIGQSGNGERRFKSHKVIKFEDTDYIDIWICLNRSIAITLETEFIKYFAPKYNKINNPNFKLVRKDVIIPSAELTSCRSLKEFKELQKKYK